MPVKEQFVVDASVIVKWFIREPDSEQALRLHDRYVKGEVQLHAPSLLEYEVLNALVHSRLFSLADLQDASRALLNYGIRLHVLDEERARTTVSLAIESGITVYDASYLALARERGCRFVTADGRLVKRMRDAKMDADISLLSEVES
jgi:predicted nucleic acid-binding protein